MNIIHCQLELLLIRHIMERTINVHTINAHEIFSKDNPQDIFSAVLTYVLQLQRDGNFQTRGSNKGEVF